MQQKNIKYLLLLGVAVIWGAILFRIIKNIDSNPTEKKALPKKLVSKGNDSSTFQPYTLLANYYDPFGADEENGSFTSPTNAIIKETPTFIEKNSKNNIKPDISFILYKGIITNSITNKKAAIISINGKDELARLDKIIDKVKINSIKKDKILVTYLNKKYWIKRQ